VRLKLNDRLKVAEKIAKYTLTTEEALVIFPEMQNLAGSETIGKRFFKHNRQI
jgi:hypothetical protein